MGGKKDHLKKEKMKTKYRGTGKAGYIDRCASREQWGVIAKRLGVYSGSVVRFHALRYAKENNLQPPPTALCKGETLYKKAAEGEDWETLGKKAKGVAQQWAYYHNHPWPPEELD